jgi:protein gp37
MAKSKIEWLDGGKTWNPVTGCTPVSPGCENCYAAVMARRLQAMGQAKYRDGFKVTLHPDELSKPLHWKKPQKIFVCSMGDLFHRAVPFEFIGKVMDTIKQTPQHTYQILTKRVERMSDFFVRYPLPNNVWLGVTVCNQNEVYRKIPALIPIPAKLRFVSIEPMLEAISLSGFLHKIMIGGNGKLVKGWVDWVIVGGETGANARPMNPDWARAIRDQCRVAGTPFFFKQMSGRQPIPADLNIREFPKKGEQ